MAALRRLFGIEQGVARVEEAFFAHLEELKVEAPSSYSLRKVGETGEGVELWLASAPDVSTFLIDTEVFASLWKADTILSPDAREALDSDTLTELGRDVEAWTVALMTALERREQVCATCGQDLTTHDKAVWSTAYVNDLPDSAFLYVRPGGSKNGDGKTVPRTNRMFPVKNAGGMVDLPHLRNALARIPQANLSADLKERLAAKARRMLESTEKAALPEGYAVVKADTAQRYTLGIAYPADDVDAHGDFTTADELEKAAWDFMARPLAGTDHADGTDEAGRVVESYIYRGPEWAVEEQTIDNGDWMLGVVWSEETWSRITAGELTGFSIQGFAQREDTE